MKTNYLLIFLITIFNLQLFSQDYEPMIKEGSFWDVVYYPSQPWPVLAGRYKINGDIIINGTSYKKIFYAPFRQSDDFLELPDGLENLYINPEEFGPIGLFIREDILEKKVFILEFDGNNYIEYTYCDFNLNIGDLVENGYSTPYQQSGLIIRDIKTSNYNGKREFVLDQFSYIEGVGKFQGPFEKYEQVLGGGGSEIFCHGNDETPNNCAEVLSTKKNELSSIKIYPNPVKDILTIKNTENVTVKIFSTTGTLLKNMKPQNDLKVDVSSFKSGIYILEISNSKGNKRSKLLKL